MVPVFEVMMAKLELGEVSNRINEEILWTMVKKCLQTDGIYKVSGFD